MGPLPPDTAATRDCLEETLAILCRCGLISAPYDLVSLHECEAAGPSGARAEQLVPEPSEPEFTGGAGAIAEFLGSRWRAVGMGRFAASVGPGTPSGQWSRHPSGQWSRHPSGQS